MGEANTSSRIVLVVPVALCLAIGIAVGHPGAGMIAAGGAVSTGFGQKHSIDNSSLLPMVFVTFGMAFSGFFGVLIGHANLLLVVTAALWGFGYGLLTNRPEGYGWVGQQCVITFLVASAFPAPVGAAIDRGLLLFSGGGLQLILRLHCCRCSEKCARVCSNSPVISAKRRPPFAPHF